MMGSSCRNTYIQFSLIDTRPLHGMADVCEKHNLKLLTYGTLVGSRDMTDSVSYSHDPQCGGFLADRWLNVAEPDLYSGSLTPSQRKVSKTLTVTATTDRPLQVSGHDRQSVGRLGAVPVSPRGPAIHRRPSWWCEYRQCRYALGSGSPVRWGGNRWYVFSRLEQLAIQHPNKHTGTRMGISDHADENTMVSELTLTDEDREVIETVLDRSNGRMLITTIGDCGAEYR